MSNLNCLNQLWPWTQDFGKNLRPSCKSYSGPASVLESQSPFLGLHDQRLFPNLYNRIRVLLLLDFSAMSWRRLATQMAWLVEFLGRKPYWICISQGSSPAKSLFLTSALMILYNSRTIMRWVCNLREKMNHLSCRLKPQSHWETCYPWHRLRNSRFSAFSSSSLFSVLNHFYNSAGMPSSSSSPGVVFLFKHDFEQNPTQWWRKENHHPCTYHFEVGHANVKEKTQ